MIILLDGQEYAVGLNWFAISSLDEVEQFQREMETTHGVLKTTKDANEQDTVALAGTEYADEVSLAGILSYAYQNLILVIKTSNKNEAGDNLYYLCAVKNGAVSVEGDVINTFEEIQLLYNQAILEFSSEMDLSEVERFGVDVTADDFEGITPVDLHHVLDPAKKFTAQCTIKVLGKKAVSPLAATMMVILFIGGGYLFYEWFFAAPPPPPAPIAQEEVRRVPVARRDPFEQFLENFASKLAGAPQAAVLEDVIATVNGIQLSYGGWQVADLTYTGGDSESLAMTLIRAPYSNVNEIFQYEEMGYFSQVAVDMAGNTATVAYPFVRENDTFISVDALKALTTDAPKRYYDLLTTFQANAIPYTSREEGFNSFFAEGAFALAGDGVWSLQQAHDLLIDFDTVGIRSVKINLENGNYQWTIEGVIYG